MNRREAMLALSAAEIPAADAESQLFTIERALGKLGTSFEQHVDLLRNSASLEVRVDYLAAVFGHYAARAAHVLMLAIVNQERTAPPAVMVGNQHLTAPIPPSAQWALDAFDERHTHERDLILEPWGLTSLNLALIRYQEVLSPESVRRAIHDTSGERRGKEQP